MLRCAALTLQQQRDVAQLVGVPGDEDAGNAALLDGEGRDLQQAAKFARPFARLSPVLDHIRERFAAPMEVASLARLVGMSARSFQRHFKKALHITPTAYIRQFRIGKACQMLIETDETISTIALETGFSDHSHLVREFTRALHTTPGAYRTRYHAV